MKISDKLLQKYAAPTVILPPPAELDEEVEVPTLKPGKLPEIKDLSEKEMKDWEDWINEKKLQKDLDITKDIVDIGKEEKAPESAGTMPAVPGKKADLSPDALVKMCARYYDLAHKL